MRPRFRARGRTTRHVPGTMNKTEQAYRDFLMARVAAGTVYEFAFEAVTLKLAPDTRFTPDFLVVGPDGAIELHEVKAGMRSGKAIIEDDAKVKIKVAAAKFPYLTFRLCVRAAACNGGNWDITEIEPC